MRHAAYENLPKKRLLDTLDSALVRERGGLAESLVCLAIVEERRLYATEKYPTMFEFCLGRLHLSEGAVYKRLRAARAARLYPVLLEAIADGRLHLSAVVELAPRLTPGNVAELVNAATHRTREDVRELLAERFPKSDVPFVLRSLPQAGGQEPLSPGTVDSGCSLALTPAAGPDASDENGATAEDATSPDGKPSPAPPAAPASPAPLASRWRISPLSPGRYKLQATLDKETLELLRRARSLLSHAMAGANEIEVLQRVLRDWVRAAEARKYGLTEKPRARKPAKATSANARRIPNAVKREVTKRDQGCCTFVDDAGRRCESRDFLEFDHITPVARGGQSTVANLRLRCSTHNQLEAEQAFGASFMQRRRDATREQRSASRGRGARDGLAAERFRSQEGEGSASRGGSAARCR